MKAAQESVVAFCNESGIAFADVSYRRLSGKEPPLKRHMGTLAVQAAAILSLASCSRSEEHTSELQSLMRISYAVFCLKKKTEYRKQKNIQTPIHKAEKSVGRLSI